MLESMQYKWPCRSMPAGCPPSGSRPAAVAHTCRRILYAPAVQPCGAGGDLKVPGGMCFRSDTLAYRHRREHARLCISGAGSAATATTSAISCLLHGATRIHMRHDGQEQI